jgi:hypothetical protein
VFTFCRLTHNQETPSSNIRLSFFNEARRFMCLCTRYIVYVHTCFYLLTRGFNWEVEFNMKVAQPLSEHKGVLPRDVVGGIKKEMLRHAFAAELTRTMLWVKSVTCDVR